VRALLISALALVAGCHRADPVPPAAPTETALHVPRATAPIKLDGEIDEDDWARAARTGAFVDAAGVEARPYSDARFLVDDEALYVALYAGDDDIRTRVTDHDGPVWLDDAFSLHITPVTMGETPKPPAQPATPGAPTYVIEISAGGVITDGRRDPSGKLDLGWESGVKIAVDRDGTPNDPSDEDEEWVIEAAIPLRSLGVRPGDQVMIDISRCDTPRAGGRRRCGSFGARTSPRSLRIAP
jgi:hypothetical protein